MPAQLSLKINRQGALCRTAVFEADRLIDIDAEAFPFNQLLFPYLSQIYYGRVALVTPDAAFVDLDSRTGFLPFETSFPKPCEGQTVLVQVRREPMPDKGSWHKGPLLTRNIILGGRYCLFHPFRQKRAISSKIDCKKSLWALKNLVAVEAPFTLRESCALASPSQIKHEMRILEQRFEEIIALQVQRVPVCMPYDALPPSKRWLRDLTPASVREIWIDDDDLYRDCRNFAQIANPELLPCIKKYTGSLFETCELEDIWDSLFADTIPIFSQTGTIAWEETAATIVVDVNQGIKQAREINDKAVPLIVQQLKWRHSGGSIIIDFAGLLSHDDKKNLEKLLLLSCQIYMLPLKILGWSRLGWLECCLPKQRVSVKRRIADIGLDSRSESIL